MKEENIKGEYQRKVAIMRNQNIFMLIYWGLK